MKPNQVKIFPCTTCLGPVWKSDYHEGPEAPEVGWAYFECPSCGNQMHPVVNSYNHQNSVSLKVPETYPDQITNFDNTVDEMENQSKQLPVLIAIDENRERLDVDIVRSIDEKHGEETPEEASERPFSLADVRLRLNSLKMIRMGLPEMEIKSPTTFPAPYNLITGEAKTTAHKAVNEMHFVRSKLGEKGQLYTPMPEPLLRPPYDCLTDIYLVGKDEYSCVKEGGNTSKFLHTLANFGILSKELVSAAHTDGIKWAWLIRSLGVPCVVLEDYMDTDAVPSPFED